MSTKEKLLSLADYLFPDVVMEVLQDYPSVRESVEIYRELPAFSSEYQPQEINLYFDDCWVATWNRRGAVTSIPQLTLPSESRVEVVELEVDGEPGLILILGVEVLNRIEKIPGHELWLIGSEAQAA